MPSLPNTYDLDIFADIMIEIANPAAGSGQILAPGIVAVKELVAVEFVLTTDANVASRLARVQATRVAAGSPTIDIGVPTTVQTAGGAIRYIFGLGLSLDMDTTTLISQAPLIQGMRMRGADTYAVTIDNIQAGDQISDTTVYFRVWPSDL
jgi:hypothetical protein